jgi:hypothetical protein
MNMLGQTELSLGSSFENDIQLEGVPASRGEILLSLVLQLWKGDALSKMPEVKLRAWATINS